MWKVVPTSVKGTSHERAGTCCQDAVAYLRVRGEKSDVLLIAIADGAGSARLSHIGSSEAVQHVLDVIPRSEIELSEITRDAAYKWMDTALAHLKAVAEREGVALGDFACTLLVAVIGGNSAVFAQIGDGGWVIEQDAHISTATWPHSGEYANITTFLTTDGALETMQFTHCQGKISAVAGFTDGIQMLALNYSVRAVHAPFFKPMFESVRICDDETSLIAPLSSFLASDAVNNRTDDDKTLILACRCGKQDGLHDVSQ
jgi:serine/threonine protein phosphatase PrpC